MGLRSTWREWRYRRDLERAGGLSGIGVEFDRYAAGIKRYEDEERRLERLIRGYEEQSLKLQESIQYMAKMDEEAAMWGPPQPEPVSEEELEEARKALEELCRE